LLTRAERIVITRIGLFELASQKTFSGDATHWS
jgi:hypothetical protein